MLAFVSGCLTPPKRLPLQTALAVECGAFVATRASGYLDDLASFKNMSKISRLLPAAARRKSCCRCSPAQLQHSDFWVGVDTALQAEIVG